MKKLIALLFAMVLSSNIAYAVPLDGSVAFMASGVNINGINLLDSTQFTPTWFIPPYNMMFGSGAGDLAGFAGTGITVTSPGYLDISGNNYLNFKWSSDIGSWTTTSMNILVHTANNLDIYLLGDFSPAGTLLSGHDLHNLASMHISMTMTGGSVSWSGTLAAPPEHVPEPATIALVGAGLVGIGLSRRRSRS